jgi:hypothetical protein
VRKRRAKSILEEHGVKILLFAFAYRSSLSDLSLASSEGQVGQTKEIGELQPKFTQDSIRQALFAEFYHWMEETKKQIEQETYDGEALLNMETSLEAIILTIPSRLLKSEHQGEESLIPDSESEILRLAKQYKLEIKLAIAERRYSIDKESETDIQLFKLRFEAALIRFQRLKSIMEENRMWFEALPFEVSISVEHYDCANCGREFLRKERMEEHTRSCLGF